LGFTFLGRGPKGEIIRAISALFYRLALKRHDKVFFQNPDDMQLFVELGLVDSSRQAVLVHGSGVDVERFRPVHFPPIISFLLIARFIQDKGIREYVEAAKIVKLQAPHVRFLLVGWIDSNPRAISREQLQAWQDSDAIEYLGKLDDVREAIARSAASRSTKSSPVCCSSWAAARPVMPPPTTTTGSLIRRGRRARRCDPRRGRSW